MPQRGRSEACPAVGLDALQYVDDSWRYDFTCPTAELRSYLRHPKARKGSDATSKIIVARPVEPSEVSQSISAKNDRAAVRRLLGNL